MSQVDVRALREQSMEGLNKELQDAHEALFKLRFQSATRQIADNSQVRKTRRRVALIKTLLQERRSSAAAE